MSADRLQIFADNNECKAYAELKVASVFDDWRVESRADNVIGLGIPSKALASACKSSQDAFKTTFRLTKRGGAPFLSFQMSNEDETRVYTADLPVVILVGSAAQALEEPSVPSVTLQMQAPSPRAAQAVLERMKALRAKRVQVAAATAGVVSFSVRSDLVAVQSFFQDLEEARAGSGAGSAGGGHLTVEGTADLGALLLVAASAAAAPKVSAHVLTVSAPSTLGWLCGLEGGMGSAVFLLALDDVRVQRVSAGPGGDGEGDGEGQEAQDGGAGSELGAEAVKGMSGKET